MVRRAANSTAARVDALMARIQGRRGTSGREPLETNAGLARFRAVPTGERAAAKKFFGNRGTPREIAHWCWRNELYDPLSSFVPELEPRRRRGFSFGSGLTGASCSPDRVGSVTSGAGYRADGAGLGRDQDVWPGSRSGEVSFLPSSVIIAGRGRPF
jgi:hypothetical protein